MLQNIVSRIEHGLKIVVLLDGSKTFLQVFYFTSNHV